MYAAKRWIRIASVLVDLKYVYVGQKAQLVYEGRRRTFRVDRISAEITSEEDGEITSGLDSLKIGSVPLLWTAGWDTQVSVRSGADHAKSLKEVRCTLGSPSIP